MAARVVGSLAIWVLAMVAIIGSVNFWPVLLDRARLSTRRASSVATMSSSSSSASSLSSWATIWLHGLGDNGPNNAALQHSFNFSNMKWRFPSAPLQPVTCNGGAVMPSWFDLAEIPITADSPNKEKELLAAVRKIHQMLDKEVDEGTSADKIFLCGFSQGGALTLASALSYRKKLAGAAVFSGWVPFGESFLETESEGKQTPLAWLHGMADQVVVFEAGQAAPPLLTRHGINCEFKAYPGLGHSINNAELAFLDQWMKARMKP